MMRIKNLGLVVVFFATIFLLSSNAKAENVILRATTDSYINSLYPNNNYSNTLLTVCNGFSPDITTRALVKFDLSQIPSGSTINSAEFGLFLDGCSPYNANVPLYASRLISVWTESTVTWSTNIHDTTVGKVATTDSRCEGNQAIGWQVKDIVQAWLGGSSNYGFYVTGSESPVYTYNFNSRNDGGRSPYLNINYSPPPAGQSAQPGSNDPSTSTASSTAGTESANSTSNSSPTSSTDKNAVNSTINSQKSDNAAENNSVGNLKSATEILKNPVKIFSSNWPWWKKAIAIWVALMTFAIIVAGVFLLVRKIKAKK